ncbi:Zn-ribbon domain-containing OB-fold protein [Yinghuangia soli]|uniref:OB-fold domain-containing protein n=1 Tax=Yinghuangia soli TaxID=2908204 RepID=A0AA41U2T1_9ACTN|nr:OB-fold domain-containing protein [Yinghuangia soli]MCF2531001.1 OB-fold domain-containing protein [Yinghuangia soli]
MPAQVPVVDYLVLEPEPRLKAVACSGCGADFLTRRNACASCGGADFADKSLATEGSVVAFTIVHRAAPGVAVPFVSAIVRLDDGPIVPGNLIGVDPTPEDVALGMGVRLTTFVAGTDDNGVEAVAYAFAPRG